MKAGVFLLPLLLLSCTLNENRPLVRAELSSEYGSGISVRVFVEGPDGHSLDGARVVIRTPFEEASLLGFDATEGCFTGYVTSGGNGDYGISVASASCPEEISLTIPHAQLSSKPAVTSIADGYGADAMSGNSLDSSLPIVVVSDSVEGATVYQARIISGLDLIMTVSSEQPSFLIPGNTISSGSYSVHVIAQYLKGDPLLCQTDYYSVSFASGSSVVFQTR